MKDFPEEIPLDHKKNSAFDISWPEIATAWADKQKERNQSTPLYSILNQKANA